MSSDAITRIVTSKVENLRVDVHLFRHDIVRAHHLISALWEASDASAPQLMDRLYSELDRGKAPDVALRNAKLSLMQTTGPFRKPLYWGVF